MLYGMIVSVAIQFLILPYVLPGIHAGNGLLAGGDFPGLHDIAARMAAKIQREGWLKWELLPEGQSSAGLASIVYALIYPSPWSLIPVNAASHALGGVAIMALVVSVSGNVTLAFIGALLCISFPSSFQWVSQIQKDSYYITGMLAILLGLITLLRYTRRESEGSALWAGLFLLAIGVLFAGTARLYALQFIWFAGTLAVLASLPSFICACAAGRISRPKSITAFVLVAAFLVAAKFGPNDSRISGGIPADQVDASTLRSESASGNLAARTAADIWKRTRVLPLVIDNQFYRLSTARLGWMGQSYASAGSMIDNDVRFSSVMQMLLYLPRALQIGFLAPFPVHWVGEGATPGGSMMRRITGLEMIILYPLLLVGLPLAAWRWRKRSEFWAVLVFCTSFILIYSYAIPNLGSLYRMRYGFLMTLAAIGFAALCLSLQDIKKSWGNSNL